MKLEKHQKIGIAITICIVLFMSVSHAISSAVYTANVSMRGRLREAGIFIYSDSNCTIRLAAIQWGTISPGASKDSTMYIYNNNTIPVRLSMLTSNWLPLEAQTYLTVSWNRENYTLPVRSSIDATITLSVSANVSGFEDFSFDITIMGIQD